VTAVDPYEGFLATAAEHLGSRARTRQATAAALPLDDASVEATVSGLVLNFTPDPLATAFRGAGLGEVRVVALDIDTPFADFDDLWNPFLGGQGPAPSYVASLDDTARTALHHRFRVRLLTQADGSITLRARAWAVSGACSAAERGSRPSTGAWGRAA
jgi:hypothetical protein